MSKRRVLAVSEKKRPFPWLLLLALLATAYLFWVLPYQLGPRPIQVEFATTPRD